MNGRAACRLARRTVVGLVLLAGLAGVAVYTASAELKQEIESPHLVRCLVQNLTQHDVRYALPERPGMAPQDLHWDYVSRGNRRALQLPSTCMLAPPANGSDLHIAWARYAPDQAAGSTRLYVVNFPGLTRPDDATGLAVRLYPGGKAAARYLDGASDVDVTAGLLADTLPAGWTPGLLASAP
ncbi:Uncharacterised protein [Bordetella ansorpii]|uniref:Uncharacterized protein n=1 Tax=Bordetella ansorpii TaxID=288768 RepID=A0A157NM29_9BORD|nr:hypothetical protein [Bordetella ansorpii]SAI22365.1 Uncharacterised protein [Bordetella ansorpii]